MPFERYFDVLVSAESSGGAARPGVSPTLGAPCRAFLTAAGCSQSFNSQCERTSMRIYGLEKHPAMVLLVWHHVRSVLCKCVQLSSNPGYGTNISVPIVYLTAHVCCLECSKLRIASSGGGTLRAALRSTSTLVIFARCGY